jgi:hypothetical protein
MPESFPAPTLLTVADVTPPQGAALSYNTGGQTPVEVPILNPTNISGLSITLADIVINGIPLTAELKVPGKKSYSDITVTATYNKSEFTGIQTALNARSPITLKLVSAGSLAPAPATTTVSFAGYFKSIQTPSVADNNEPLTYEFSMMVNTVTVA